MTAPVPPPTGPADVSSRPSRSIPLVPTIVIAVLAMALVAAVAVAVTLAVREPSSAPSPGATPSAAATDPAPSAMPTVPAPPPAAAPEPFRGFGSCSSPSGASGPVDLRTVSFDPADELTIEFELAAPLGEGESTLEFGATDRGYSFRVETLWRSGELRDVEAQTLMSPGSDDDEVDRGGKGDGEDIDVRRRDVSVDGTTVVVRLPDDVAERLGEDVSWYAVATASGTVSDTCPN